MADVESIVVVTSYAEALVVQSRLDEAGIPYHLQPFNDPGFGSFWRKEEGWGVVLAPAEYRATIERICSDIRSARNNAGD